MSYDRVFHALSDPTRRAILERLRDGARSVGEIASGLPVSRPAVSQHLKVLKDAALVREQTRGRRHLYQADRRGLAELRRYLEEHWDAVLGRFQIVAEAEPEDTNGSNGR
jgi:DNA-binding transcriptional ArsR family regulator